MKPGSRYRMLSLLLLVVCCWNGAQQIHCLPLGNAQTALEIRLVREGQIYDRAADKTIEWRQLVAQLALARIAVLGESHDNYQHHLGQARLIEELVQAGKKVAVGMEFFNVEQQPILDRWSKGELDESRLLAESDWFNKVGFNYRYYRPILEVARRHRLPVAALNIPRRIVHKVSRQGLSALTAQERASFPAVKTDNRQHRYLLQRIFGKFALIMPQRFERMYTAQCVWDVAMAHNIASALDRAGKDCLLVAIAGSGHVIYDLGIPSRLAAANHSCYSVVFEGIEPEKKGKTTGQNKQPPKKANKDPHFKMGMTELKNTTIIARNLADFVIATSNSQGREEFINPGIQLEERQGKLVITKTPTSGLGKLAGWQKNDVLLTLDDRNKLTLIQAQLFLTYRNWSDTFTWEITRNGKNIRGKTMVVRD